MLIYFLLVFSFLQIGFFGFGGPDALQAFVESETVMLHQWLTPEQYADLLALCKMVPGDAALNAATLTGWLTTNGTYGFWPAVGASALASAALAVPALLWTGIVASFNAYTRHTGGRRGGIYAIKVSVLNVLRPLTPGLMLAAILILARPENFGSPASTPWQFWISLFLFAATLVGSMVYRFNALFLVLLCGVAGRLLL